MTPLDKLVQFLRIPSVSADPAHAADVRRAAEWVAAELAVLPHVELIEAPGRHPLVYAESVAAPGKPTLLLYGHYDVQPPDPLELWHSPPFEPVIRDNNIYARGACDDKGQTLILLTAVRQLIERDGRLPCNIKILIEGEEESGGEHITAYVPGHTRELAADAALICDTEMFAPGLPALCVGLRGIVYGEIHVQGPAQDLHSGVYGGVAPNPVMAVAEILTALKNRDGHITIPGFYDAVRAPSPEESRAWATLPFDEEHYRRTEVGASALTGEPGYSVFARTWARPTLEVHGIRGGFTGEGAKTVIPATAVAKVSLRLVPDQDPATAVEQIQAAIAAATPRGVTAEFRLLHGAPPASVDPSHPLLAKAAAALTEAFGRETVYIRSGGSIPIVGLFQEALGIPSILMGFGLPDDGLHSPNEKFHLPNFHQGIETVEKFLLSL